MPKECNRLPSDAVIALIKPLRDWQRQASRRWIAGFSWPSMLLPRLQHSAATPSVPTGQVDRLQIETFPVSVDPKRHYSPIRCSSLSYQVLIHTYPLAMGIHRYALKRPCYG